ncbi:MAG: sugar phosphate isomerase/epimerase [Paracoccus sp. (in: a-proteobacteria)]|jgi:sugar phosphate isomerase/epimerase
MYPAIFARTYPLTTAPAVLDAVARDGYAGVQFNLSCIGLDPVPQTLPEGAAETVATEAAARDLRIAALSGTYNMAHPDATVRLAFRPRFANVVAAARAMGAPMVTLCTGSRNPTDMWAAHPDNASDAAMRDFRAELDFALQLASDAGIKLAIEPEPGNVIADARIARRLLDQVGAAHLGIILDAANLLSPATLPRQHEIMAKAVDLLGDDLLLAHAKDIATDGRVVAPGRGAVDLPAFVALLRSAGFDGALVAHGFDAADTAPAARALQDLIAGAP